jgi:hypothetical protein
VQDEIAQFPHSASDRRNTGYAVDVLLDQKPFSAEWRGPESLAKLLAGSEGTLAFTTAIKLHVDPLPPKHEAVVCIHFNRLTRMHGSHRFGHGKQRLPMRVGGQDCVGCHQGQFEQSENRFFVEGDPAAILCVENFARED